MAAAMIMNSNSLPVALLQSLVVSVPGLERGQDDTIDSIVGRALTYILLSGTMGQFVSFFLSLIMLKAFTISRFVGVTESTYSLKLLFQTKLSVSLCSTMEATHPNLPKAWNV